MAYKIVFSPSFPPSIMEIANELLPNGFTLHVVEQTASDEEFKEALRDADFFMGFGANRLNREIYQASPSLKLVQLTSAGYDRIDLEAAREARVPIANNGGANSTAVAEHAIMLMLAVAKRLTFHHANVKAGLWRGGNFAENPIYELEGKTLGIIGLGRIGKKVARRALGLEMRVQYYDIIRQMEHEDEAMGIRFVSFKELLTTSDLITIHVPLNDATRGMISTNELTMMKKSAFLVNTCRGPVIDEEALYRALVEKQISGAGLDVFMQEPTPADNPLLKLEEVIATPHSAGPTWENWTKTFRSGFYNIERVAAGEPPRWVVPELREIFP